MYINSVEDIKSYEIEITSNCNAKCPDCSRTRLLKENQLPINEIDINDFRRWFTREYVENRNFYFCGALGDAVVHKDCMLFIDHLKSLNAKRVEVVTNGSIRKPEWWKELATKAYVIFSIDGLEDTNHIYRVNTNFKKIMENVEAFIGAGGTAQWEYLIFDHNQHQVQEAELLAKEMRFEKIVFKKTARSTVMGKNVQSKEKRKKKFIESVNYEIRCKWKKDKRLFISSYNELLPCCHFNWPHRYQSDLNKKYNDFYNLNKYTIDEILHHKFYSSDLENSWLDNIPVSEGGKKYSCCSEKCNVKTGNINWRKNDREKYF